MVKTEICGKQVGYNALVSDLSTAAAEPAVIRDVTAGSVVILQVAPCGHGRRVELNPASGAGEITQHVRDAEGRDVGLVIKPVLGRTLRVTDISPSSPMVIATITIEHP